jgi:hypothetical protein
MGVASGLVEGRWVGVGVKLGFAVGFVLVVRVEDAADGVGLDVVLVELGGAFVVIL